MSVFKRKRTNRKGTVALDGVYNVEIRDHLGIVRRVAAFSDKSASKELERNLKKLVALRMAGSAPDAELSRFLESCPELIRGSLAKWEIIDTARASAGRGIATHIKDWRASMQANGLSRKQVVANAGKVERVVKRSGWRSLSDISANGMEKWRLAAKKDGMSLMTTNHYLAAAKAFCNWLVKEKRLVANPLEHMTKLNAATDRRRERRAFVIGELERILAAAKGGAYTHGLTGYERYLLYRVAVSTGYRWSEIKSFRKSSIDFGSKPVTLAIRAEDAKNGLDDALPLPDDLAAELKQHLALYMPDAPIFPRMDDHGAEMLRVDLEAAGVSYIDEYGCVGDFHSFRHTFGTLGAKAGIPLATMQKLMRHSTPVLTANLYTHILIKDKADALKLMPAIEAVANVDKETATGTCDLVSEAGENVDSPGDSFSTDFDGRIRTCMDGQERPNSAVRHAPKTQKPPVAQGEITGGERGIPRNCFFAYFYNPV